MSLERDLRALAAELEWPDTPALAPLELARRRNLRPLVLALAVLVLALAVAFAVPPARSTFRILEATRDETGHRTSGNTSSPWFPSWSAIWVPRTSPANVTTVPVTWVKELPIRRSSSGTSDGTTAPVVSLTVPRIVAVILCAMEGTAGRTRRAIRNTVILRMAETSGGLVRMFYEANLARERVLLSRFFWRPGPGVLAMARHD